MKDADGKPDTDFSSQKRSYLASIVPTGYYYMLTETQKKLLSGWNVILKDLTFESFYGIYGYDLEKLTFDKMIVENSTKGNFYGVYLYDARKDDSPVTMENLVINTGTTIEYDFFGSYLEGKYQGKAITNNFTINEGIFKGMVIGAYSRDIEETPKATMTINGGNFENARIYVSVKDEYDNSTGKYYFETDGSKYGDNIINFGVTPNTFKAKNIYNANVMNFVLPADVKNDDKITTYTDTAGTSLKGLKEK